MENKTNIELTDLKQAFDHADETSDGAIKSHTVINILNDLGIEDISEEQIKKGLQQIKSNYGQNEEAEQQILYNEFLELMTNLGLRKNEYTNLNTNPIQFLGNNQIFYLNKNNFSMKVIEDAGNELNIMKKRLDLNYGLDTVQNNKIMNENPELFKGAQFSQDLWNWVNELKIAESNKDSKMSKGFLQQIQKNEKNMNQTQPKYIYFGHNIYESKERTQCLKNFGWSGSIKNIFTSNKYLESIEKLQNNKQYTRAAMISIFHFDFIQAYQCLQNQKENISEGQKFLKSILLGLKNIQEYIKRDDIIIQQFYLQNGGDPDDEHEIPSRNFNEKQSQQQGLSQEFDIFSENPNFSLLDQDDHQKILMMLQNFLSFIKKLCKDAQFEQPFVRCICQFISNDNYQEILEEKNIPVLDKICYALRFADFQSLNDFLDKQINESINKGLLDGLIYLGSQDERAVQIVQNYINQTNDIQTAALISQYLLFFNFTNKQKLHNFYQCYKDLLNKLELYEERFSLERSVQNLEKQFPQYKRLDNLQEQIDKSAIHQVCKKCSYVLTHKNILKQLSRGQMKYNFNLLNGSDSQKINQCPSCNAKLHLCNICRLPLQIANPSFYFTQMKKQNKTDQNDITNNLDDAIVWCQQCDHGGHFNHIYEWFSEYSHCPVSDCNCQCSIL